jgi:hypothetical protein
MLIHLDVLYERRLFKYEPTTRAEREIVEIEISLQLSKLLKCEIVNITQTRRNDRFCLFVIL